MKPFSSAGHARLRLSVSFHINYRSRINKIGQAVKRATASSSAMLSHFAELIKYYYSLTSATEVLAIAL